MISCLAAKKEAPHIVENYHNLTLDVVVDGKVVKSVPFMNRGLYDAYKGETQQKIAEEEIRKVKPKLDKLLYNLTNEWREAIPSLTKVEKLYLEWKKKSDAAIRKMLKAKEGTPEHEQALSEVRWCGMVMNGAKYDTVRQSLRDGTYKGGKHRSSVMKPQVGDQLKIQGDDLFPMFATISGYHSNEIEYISSQEGDKVKGGSVAISDLEPLTNPPEKTVASAMHHWQIKAGAKVTPFHKSSGEMFNEAANTAAKEEAENGQGEPKQKMIPFTITVNWYGQIMTERTMAPSEAKARSNALYKIAQTLGKPAAHVFAYFKERQVSIKQGH